MHPGMDPQRSYDFRCPVHGFIKVSDWERRIINSPAFQRLRRVRQLAWTDHVYPGATHTRFEHSLGVMHVATRLFDGIVNSSRSVLTSKLGYNDTGLGHDRQLVRLAALLHDVGHTPFSHAGEEVMPLKGSSSGRYKHEDYSAAIIRRCLTDVIEGHPDSQNFSIRADDVADLIDREGLSRSIFWRELISGQIDADRMDYLLRDSLHAGVQYGRFDFDRLAATVQVVSWGAEAGEQSVRIGLAEGGLHAAEALVLARYFMFTQVYFHKTRVAFDHHLKHALGSMLTDGVFPLPTTDANLQEYLRWDDWRVLGLLKDGLGGEHGSRLATRDHYREVFHTPEAPSPEDLTFLEDVRSELGTLVAAEESAEKSWYKTGAAEDIRVASESEPGRVSPLSTLSVVGKIPASRQVLLYSRPEEAEAARKTVRRTRGGH